MTIEPLLVRKLEAAKLLAMSVSTIEKLTSKRQIPHLKIGRGVYYDVSDLRAWLEAKKVRMPPSAAAVAC